MINHILKTVKISLYFILIFSIKIAQKDLKVISGYNFSSINYNQSQINDGIDIGSRRGYNLGIEYHYTNLIVGLKVA